MKKSGIFCCCLPYGRGDFDPGQRGGNEGDGLETVLYGYGAQEKLILTQMKVREGIRWPAELQGGSRGQSGVNRQLFTKRER